MGQADAYQINGYGCHADDRKHHDDCDDVFRRHDDVPYQMNSFSLSRSRFALPQGRTGSSGAGKPVPAPLNSSARQWDNGVCSWDNEAERL